MVRSCRTWNTLVKKNKEANQSPRSKALLCFAIKLLPKQLLWVSSHLPISSPVAPKISLCDLRSKDFKCLVFPTYFSTLFPSGVDSFMYLTCVSLHSPSECSGCGPLSLQCQRVSSVWQNSILFHVSFIVYDVFCLPGSPECLLSLLAPQLCNWGYS